MEAVITDSGFARAINGRRFAEPMKAALLAVLQGHSYRIAADKFGLDHRRRSPGSQEGTGAAGGPSAGLG